jgi:hypothetical protein
MTLALGSPSGWGIMVSLEWSWRGVEGAYEPCFGVEGVIPDFVDSFDFGGHIEYVVVKSQLWLYSWRDVE